MQAFFCLGFGRGEQGAQRDRHEAAISTNGIVWVSNVEQVPWEAILGGKAKRSKWAAWKVGFGVDSVCYVPDPV